MTKGQSEYSIGEAFALGGIALVIIAPMIAAAFVVEAWAVWLLWQWFVIPLGIPPLSIWHALGISLIVGVLTNQYYATPEGKHWERIRFMFGHPLAALGVGWIVKTWGLS